MQRLARRVVQAFDRYMPEPFAFGILMTIIAMLIAWGTTESTAVQVIVAWGNGLSSLLAL